MPESGSGFGSNSGDGCGDGSGDGFGSSYGCGDGYGYCNGDQIGIINGNVVLLLSPWKYLRVGCQMYSVEHWRANWREIAAEHGVLVTEDEVETLLKAVTRKDTT